MSFPQARGGGNGCDGICVPVAWVIVGAASGIVAVSLDDGGGVW